MSPSTVLHSGDSSGIPSSVIMTCRRRARLVFPLVLVLSAVGSCGDPVPIPTRVIVIPGSPQFAALGDTARLTAQVHDQNGELMTGVSVTWASNDPAVATVDGSGLVRSVGNGKTVVAAKANLVSGTTDVTVAQVVMAVSVSPGTLEFSALGDTLRVAAVAVDANGHPVEGAEFTWTSGDTAVVAVDASGLVRSVDNGRTAVTVAVDSASDSAAVTVAQVARSVAVSPTTARMTVLGRNRTVQLAAQARDANGHTVASPSFTWASDADSVAAVDSAGLVEAVGYGVATITATADSASGSATVTVEEDLERKALVTLYKATNGPNWSRKGNWLTDEPVGSWFGVEVSEEGAVMGLHLNRNGLVGPIPAELGKLSELRVLNLIQNRLSGPIAPELGKLSSLVRLWLAWNELTDIPPELGDLANLESMYLAGNRFTGAIPRELGNLSNLTGLDLSASGLTGSIPAELGNLSSLLLLNLSWNGLTGRIPPELGKLSNLVLLRLRSNGLTDIPPELGDLANLEEMDLGGNRLTGTIPPELGNLSNLVLLNLTRNGLTGPIPPELGKLLKLTQLYLLRNRLTGPIPPELGELSSLVRLWLHSNELTTIPPELGDLANLESMDLGGNRLAGTIPPELGNLSNLVFLSLSGNGLTGPIPPELGKLSKLTQLSLVNNELSGPIPPELGELSNLNLLYLMGNKLTGPLPPELGKLSSLTLLWLYSNELTGTIPPEWGDLAGLEDLRLPDNSLTGAIPAELGKLSKLGALWLNHNNLSGSLPPEIGDLESLRYLTLTANPKMMGVLPETMTALGRLDELFLGDTGLCAPNNPDFLRWLRSVPRQRVRICDPSAAYLVQAIQSRAFPVSLVAEKPALLRVFVTATKETDAKIPPVRATFYLDDEKVHKATIPAKSAAIPTKVDESSLALSSNAEIPDSVLKPDLEMVIEIDPDSTLDADLLVAKRIPATGRASVDVADMPLMELTVVPLLWKQNPDSSVLDVTEDMTDEHPLFTDTRALLPISDMNVTVHDPVWSSTNQIHKLLGEVTVLRRVEGGTGYWMGIMRNAVGASGTAYRPGWTSVVGPHTGWWARYVVAHELGHNMILAHAPCGGAPLSDGFYPHSDGSIGAWGYDFRSKDLVPPGRKDLMGYCNPHWIGDYHFSNALRHRLAAEGSRAYTSGASSVRSLLLWGGADADGVPFLEPAFVVDAPPSLPDSGGEYRLTGSDGDGNELFALDFETREVTHLDGRSLFAFVLPVPSGWDDALAKLTMTGPGGSATLTTESDIPMALLRDPRTGQMRGFVRGRDAVDLAAGRTTEWSRLGLEAIFSRGVPGPADWRR